MREVRGWVPVGYTLSSDDATIRTMFKREHPSHHGELRLTPLADGFTKMEFRGVVRAP